MCFSASASFGAGAVLSVIGVATFKKATSRKQLAFAAIPLIFCVQQVSEGFLWLALSNPDYVHWQKLTTYTFLFFAQVVWPTWVPVSIYIMDKEGHYKMFQRLLIGAGGLVSLYLGYCLLTFPVEAKIIGYHISYEQDFPYVFGRLSGLLYILATIAPSFLSSNRRMWMLGTATAISYIITTIFYNDYIVSVWCFFASIISISIFVILPEIKKSDMEPSLARTTSALAD